MNEWNSSRDTAPHVTAYTESSSPERRDVLKVQTQSRGKGTGQVSNYELLAGCHKLWSPGLLRSTFVSQVWHNSTPSSVGPSRITLCVSHAGDWRTGSSFLSVFFIPAATSCMCQWPQHAPNTPCPKRLLNRWFSGCAVMLATFSCGHVAMVCLHSVVHIKRKYSAVHLVPVPPPPPFPFVGRAPWPSLPPNLIVMHKKVLIL